MSDAEIDLRREAASSSPDDAVLAEENRALEDALALSRRRLSAMREVAQALAGQLELDQLLAVLISKVSDLTDCDRATLFFVDEERQELWSRVAEGLAGEAAAQARDAGLIRLPLGKGVAGFVATTGVALNLPDAYTDPRFSPEVDQRTGYRTSTLLCTPIVDERGAVTGVIEALNKRSGPFTVEDERLLEAIGHQISVAVKNALLFEELKRKASSLEVARAELARRVSELDLLSDVERAMSSAESPEELLDVVVRRATDIVGADAASIAIVDPSTGGLRFRAATGDAADQVLKRSLLPGRGLVGIAAENGEPVITVDAMSDPRHDRSVSEALGFSPGPVVAVPLLAAGRTLGAVEVMRLQGGKPFTPDDQRILTLLSGRVASALSAARRRERTKREEQLQTIGTMLAGIVHDFKTPMTVISGYVQLMEDADDADERREHAEVVLKQTDMLASMTKELLQFARGETEILVRKVYLEGFVRDLRDMLAQVFKGTAIDVTVELKYRGSLRCDDIKLKRALANLAKNAREAMEDRGSFRVTVDRVGDQVELEVKDTGPGLPDEIESRLFESFATHGKAGGTGLGLALVKKIVDDHQGEIRVENDKGKGVTFRLRLPL